MRVNMSTGAPTTIPVPQKIFRAAVGAQPVLGVFESGVVGVKDLREGDILLMLGIYPSSCLVCCCACSPGSSHVGTMIKLDGKLWLAEAASFQEEDVKLWIGIEDAHPTPSGVIASNVNDSIKYYAAIDVYRPRGMTPQKAKLLKDKFCELRTLPYEKSMLQILNVACGCDCLPYTNDSIFCSELTALMFENADLVNRKSKCCFCIPDYRHRTDGYRPIDIPRIIDCDRLGRLEGTRSIFDVRSFTFGLCD